MNVLVQAFRKDASEHDRCLRWLHSVVNGSSRYGVAPQALSGLVRICTHPKIFLKPSTVGDALNFCEDVLSGQSAVIVTPRDRHWSIFDNLCRSLDARGNLVQDIWLAALALEWGCEFVTFDRDFQRVPSLNVSQPP